MAKFMSDEYVAQVQAALLADPKWAETSKSLKSSIAMNVTDTGQNYLLLVENGATTFQKVAPGASAEFTLDGSYDSWCKLGKGEVDIQSAVLKGLLKFKGSLTKALMYRDKLTQIAEVMRAVPTEF
jgi:putative sterol carrier protein